MNLLSALMVSWRIIANRKHFSTLSTFWSSSFGGSQSFCNELNAAIRLSRLGVSVPAEYLDSHSVYLSAQPSNTWTPYVVDVTAALIPIKQSGDSDYPMKGVSFDCRMRFFQEAVDTKDWMSLAADIVREIDATEWKTLQLFECISGLPSYDPLGEFSRHHSDEVLA